MSRSESRSPGLTDNESFDPLDFLRVAAGVVPSETDQALLRMAIGRTYYALFLIARDRMDITSHRSVHDAVSRELSAHGHGELASRLGQIRSVRELADYQIVPENPHWREWTWNWRYVRRIANGALNEMTNLGWLTSPPLMPTD